MDLAVEGHMLPGDVTLDPTNARSIAGITASEFAALYQEKTNYTSPFGTNLVAQIYDAVWAMALALDAAERELIQSGKYIYTRHICIKFPRGDIWDFGPFFKQISDLLKKLWTFQYAAGFRGPGILIKRSTIVDLSVYAAWLRGPDISQNIQKIF